MSTPKGSNKNLTMKAIAAVARLQLGIGKGEMRTIWSRHLRGVLWWRNWGGECESMLKVPAINCKFRGAMNGPRVYMLLYNLILYRNRVMPCVRQTTPIADNHIHRIVLLLLRCWPSLAQLAARGGNDEEKLQKQYRRHPRCRRQRTKNTHSVQLFCIAR